MLPDDVTYEDAIALCERYSTQVIDWLRNVNESLGDPTQKGEVYAPPSFWEGDDRRTSCTMEQAETQIAMAARIAAHYANLMLGPEQRVVKAEQKEDVERAEREAEALIDIFTEKFKKKYVDGQIEHGGRLMDMPPMQLTQNIAEEVMDLWAYTMALMLQMRR